jgi:hypothetical protein
MTLHEFDTLWSNTRPDLCRNRMAELLARMHLHEERQKAVERSYAWHNQIASP